MNKLPIEIIELIVSFGPYKEIKTLNKYYNSDYKYPYVIKYKDIDKIPLKCIIKLDCSSITSLKEIPDGLTSLEELYCNHCDNLKEIPNTFTSLTYLDCEYTSVKEIPNGLTSLNCRNL